MCLRLTRKIDKESLLSSKIKNEFGDKMVVSPSGMTAGMPHIIKKILAESPNFSKKERFVIYDNKAFYDNKTHTEEK